MKRLLFALSILTVVFTFCGCSDDGEQDFSLVGETYAAFDYSSYDIFGDRYDVYKVWRFISETEVEETSRENSPIGDIIGDVEKGTYLVDYPNMKVRILDGVSNNSYECEFIDENTFRCYWYNIAGDKEPHEFTKQ